MDAVSDYFMRGAVVGIIVAVVLFRLIFGRDRGPQMREGYAAPRTSSPSKGPFAPPQSVSLPRPGWKNDAPDLTSCDRCRRVYPVGADHVCPRPFANA